jgi:hypothetical protein
LAQPLQVTQQNTARLFKKDYSVHPILGSRAFADTCIEEGKQAIHKRDTLLGKSQDEIIDSEGQPLIQLGYNDIWDSRKDITAHWFYYAKPRFPMRLAFSGTKCVDACILNSEQVHDLFIWRMCQINGSKKDKQTTQFSSLHNPRRWSRGKDDSRDCGAIRQATEDRNFWPTDEIVLPCASRGLVRTLNYKW